MKTFLITALVILTTSTGLLAQTQVKPGVGINFTSITGGGEDVSGRIGWQIGGSVAFGDKFYIEPGIFYQTESVEYVSLASPTATEATYSGVRVPLAIGLDILGGTDSTIGLRGFGGGSGYFVTGTTSDVFDKDDFRSPKWGVFAGLGIDISLFYLDLSYQWSLTDIQEDISNVDLGKSNAFFVTAGIRF